MVSYQELLPIGSLLLLCACSFLLGLTAANWPYDFYTLWDGTKGQALFDKALVHYQTLGSQPPLINYTFAVIIALGFIGCGIKIFRPTEDTQYFEYGSLVAYVSAVCVYLTNVRNGEMSAIYDSWGDVDQNTGLSVIGASNVMIIFLLLGIVILQAGLFYAEYADFQAKNTFFLRELGASYEGALNAAEKKFQQAQAAPAPEAEPAVPVKKAKGTTGAAPKQTAAKKVKRKA